MDLIVHGLGLRPWVLRKFLCINKSLVQLFFVPSKVLCIYQGKNISLYILGSNAILYFRLNFPRFLELLIIEQSTQGCPDLWPLQPCMNLLCPPTILSFTLYSYLLVKCAFKWPPFITLSGRHFHIILH